MTAAPGEVREARRAYGPSAHRRFQQAYVGEAWYSLNMSAAAPICVSGAMREKWLARLSHHSWRRMSSFSRREMSARVAWRRQ